MSSDKKALLEGGHGGGGHGSTDNHDQGGGDLDGQKEREPGTFDPTPPERRGSCYNAKIDKFFKVSERGSTIWTEIRAGLVTFVTMAYILLVNPLVLTQSGQCKESPVTHKIVCGPGGEMPIDPIVTATALSAATASILVGILGNLPFGMAAGMGLNSYFTFGVVIKLGLTWQVALATAFFQGVAFSILALTGLCAWIQRYAPPCIKKSITVGLGLFQALIGLQQMKLVIAGESGSEMLIRLGPIDEADIWLGCAGIVIITVLMVLDVRAAMLIGILFVSLVSWIAKVHPWPEGVVSLPQFHTTWGVVDFKGYFEHASDTIPVSLVFLFISIFDTAGVQFAAGQQAGLLDKEHRLPAATQAFFSAGVATTAGALMGTSPVIIHNETCAGIHDGGRTGLTAVTVGCAFILTLPFAPLFRGVPLVASAAPLVIVGALMMACAKFIDWEQFDEALPAFLVVCILPFTYSIANGFFFGLGAYILVKGGIWIMAKILRRNANVIPVTVPEESGVPDPVPGVPTTPFVYHSDSYMQKMMSASQAAMMSRSQRIIAGGSLTGSNSTHYMPAAEAESGSARTGGINPPPSGDGTSGSSSMSAGAKRLALSRSMNQFSQQARMQASFSRSKGALHSSASDRFH